MREPRALARTLAAATLLALLSAAPPGRAETISPDSWIYDALRSFEVRGLVRLEPTLPYTFDECERYVREIDAAVEREGVALGPRHRFLLDRLEREFVGKGSGPEDRDDGPVAVVREGERWAAFDATIGGAFVKGLDAKRGEGDGLATTGLLVDLGRRLTLETEYRLVLGPERGDRVHDAKPSARTRSYRGLTGELARGLVAMNGSWWDVRAGREYIQWGSSRADGLAVSRAAGSFDHVGGSFRLGRFTLSTFQASLDSYYGRRMAAHRLTVELPRGIALGVGETVIYYRRSFDWKYATPIGFFYAHQYSEGMQNEDNVVCSIDAKWPVARNLLLHGELLVDDVQYERGDDAGPDRIGFDVAAEGLVTVAGRELELSAGYTRINAYTYGHGVMTAYVTGAVPYDALDSSNTLIGGETLGPDADRTFAAASFGFSERIAIGVGGSYERYGHLSRLLQLGVPNWRPGMDNDPCFPSGPVLTERRLSGSLRYDLGGGSYAAAEGEARWRYYDGDFVARHYGCRIEIALDL